MGGAIALLSRSLTRVVCLPLPLCWWLNSVVPVPPPPFSFARIHPLGFADRPMAELDKDVKNSISHRRRAVEQLRDWLLVNPGEWGSSQPPVKKQKGDDAE